MLRLLGPKPVGYENVIARLEPVAMKRTLDPGQHLQLDFECKERRFVFGEADALGHDWRRSSRGALIGGLAGGGKGAGVGALLGAGARLMGGAMTGNKQIEIPAESALSFQWSAPMTFPPGQ